MLTPDQELANRVFSFKVDPLGFVEWAFPWGREGTDLADKQLEDWQRGVLIELGDFLKDHEFRALNKFDLPKFRKAIASGHGIGKSSLMAMLILFFMSTRMNCKGVVAANTGDQLSTKTWPTLQWWLARIINKSWFEWTAEKLRCVLKVDGADTENWRFDAATWSENNTEAFQGTHNQTGTIIMFDEASNIFERVWEVTRGGPMKDPLACWFAFGNPTRNTGEFRKCFGEHRDLWRPQHIDSRSCRINASSHGEYDLDVKQYGEDSNYVRVRIRGQFPYQGDKQFISAKLVEDAQVRELPHDAMAPLIMGIDPSRGGDKFVIRWRRGRDARSIPPTKWRDIKTMEAVHRIADLIGKYDPDAVCIDAGATGAAIGDILRSLGYKVHLVWFGNKLAEGAYANVRVRLWGDMRDWLEEGMIDRDQELYDDLIGPEYGFQGRDGDQQLLESKESMKQRGLDSPDDGDALAVTFAVKVARRDKHVSRNVRQARQATGIDHDPLS